ncbi:Mpv17/PMP22 [Trinorchestia longiramus]|nr:Mpv17/PMP22 [Trinorchestia longiramus]
MQALAGALKRSPVLTNTIVYGTLYVSAEFGQQMFSRYTSEELKPGEQHPPIDTGALARFGVMGTCVLPHTLYQAYKRLDAWYPGNSGPMALRKLAIDAFIITPFNLTLFYIGMSAMERKEDLLAEWKAKLIPTFITASCFWVPANFLNFKVLPPHMRVVFVGGCQIIWVSILCWFKKQEF